MNEFDRAAADHFLRQISQDGLAARADLNQNSPGIHHHDQILRGFEDAAALLDLPPQRLPVRLASVMSRAIFDEPMVAPEGDLIGEC